MRSLSVPRLPGWSSTGQLAYQSILAAATGGLDSNNTAPATVVAKVQLGRRWSSKDTHQHDCCHEGRSDASEREYELEELLLDEFDLINAYKHKVAEVARLRNILDQAGQTTQQKAQNIALSADRRHSSRHSTVHHQRAHGGAAGSHIQRRRSKRQEQVPLWRRAWSRRRYWSGGRQPPGRGGAPAHGDAAGPAGRKAAQPARLRCAARRKGCSSNCGSGSWIRSLGVVCVLQGCDGAGVGGHRKSGMGWGGGWEDQENAI
jgi:hypothetical protein